MAIIVLYPKAGNRKDEPMNYEGILIGLGAFLIIGVRHPVVIKTEYRYGKRAWPVFWRQVSACALSLFLPGHVLPALPAVLGSLCCGAYLSCTNRRGV